MNKRLSALLGTTMLAGTLLSAPAFAQEADNATQVDEIIVTGTRIVRPNQTSATAVHSVTAEAIATSGETNLGDILRTLPSAGVSGFTPVSSNFQTSDNGVTTVNLRGMGESRTLVLVNGRRFVGGVAGTQVVDFAMLPTEFVQRVDVVSGGASSIYGSDALAGVINIVTQRDFTGFETFGQYGITERGDRETFKLGFKAGSNFADDRGNFVMSLSYDESGGVYARDRADRGMHLDGSAGATFKDTVYFYGSSVIPQGQAQIPGMTIGGSTPALGRWVYDNGAARIFTAADAFNRQAYRALVVPTDALQFSTQMNYRLNEKHNFFLEGSYYRGNASNRIEPTPLQSSDLFRDAMDVGQNVTCVPGAGCQYGISILSEIIPMPLRQVVRDSTPGLTDEQRMIGFTRRTMEIGNRVNKESRQTHRVVGGLEGDLGGPLNLRYEVSANWGRSTQQQIHTGALLRQNVLNALDVVKLADGSLACRSEEARAQGCAPFFVFEPGKTGQKAVDYMQITNTNDGFLDQKVLSGFVSGDAFQLPAGPVQFVAGAEYRREESRFTPDATQRKGLGTGNITPETKGSFDVKEAFLELNVPILADLSWAHQLDLNLSYRLSEYSTVGKTDAWAAALEYMPTDWLKVRSQFSSSVRAPNINEMYEGRSQTFPDMPDPCRGLTMSGGQAAFFNDRDSADVGTVVGKGIDASTVGSNTAKACAADPGLAARLARDGHFIQTQSEKQGFTGFNQGNQDLEAEEAKSLTLGVLFNPTWNDWWSGLSVSVDYFQIEIDNMISQLARDASLRECYVNSGGVYDADSIYCKSIIRHAAGNAEVGAFRELNAMTQNLGTNRTRGLDLQASYRVDMTRLPMLSGFEDAGQLAITYAHQHLLTNKLSPIAGAEMVERAGSSFYPKNRGMLNMLYNRGPLTLSWATTFIGASCYMGESKCDKDDQSGYIGLRHFSDFQARYDLTERTEVFLGVDNVFDEYVHIGMGHGQPTGWTTDPGIYDGIGRRFNVGARMRF